MHVAILVSGNPTKMVTMHTLLQQKKTITDVLLIFTSIHSLTIVTITIILCDVSQLTITIILNKTQPSVEPKLPVNMVNYSHTIYSRNHPYRNDWWPIGAKSCTLVEDSMNRLHWWWWWLNIWNVGRGLFRVGSWLRRTILLLAYCRLTCIVRISDDRTHKQI